MKYIHILFALCILVSCATTETTSEVQNENTELIEMVPFVDSVASIVAEDSSSLVEKITNEDINTSKDVFTDVEEKLETETEDAMPSIEVPIPVDILEEENTLEIDKDIVVDDKDTVVDIEADCPPVCEIPEEKTIDSVILPFVNKLVMTIKQELVQAFDTYVVSKSLDALKNDIDHKLLTNPITDVTEAEEIVKILDGVIVDTAIDTVLKTNVEEISESLQDSIEIALIDALNLTLKQYIGLDFTESTESKESLNTDENTDIDLVKEMEDVLETTAQREIEDIEIEDVRFSLFPPNPFEPEVGEVIPLDKIDFITREKSDEIVVSQKHEIFVGDYLDIILNGDKWIYLGEIEPSKTPVVSFYNRYFDGMDSFFGFDAKVKGKSILHFYKQDFLTNSIIDEYVEVTVKQVVPVKNSFTVKTQTKNEEILGISAEPEVSLLGSKGEVIVQDFAVQDSFGFDAEIILDEAELAFSNNDIEDCIALLDEYTSLGVDAVDKALYLYGQCYEASTVQKNIRLSHSFYTKLVESFTESIYYADAEKRLRYLERFYFIKN